LGSEQNLTLLLAGDRLKGTIAPKVISSPKRAYFFTKIAIINQRT